jgi:hypothetical protein
MFVYSLRHFALAASHPLALYQETSNTYIIRVNYYQSLTFMNVIIDVEEGARKERHERERNQRRT